jgi:hypothetical protein
LPFATFGNSLLLIRSQAIVAVKLGKDLHDALEIAHGLNAVVGVHVNPHVPEIEALLKREAT